MQADGHALFEVVLALGLLSTAILGALAAEWSMAYASRAAALRGQAFLLADTRVEAEHSGASYSLDWARRAAVLPHGNIEMAPVDEGMHGVTVTWDERVEPHRRRATLAYRQKTPS
jgi:hypothetical protein